MIISILIAMVIFFVQCVDQSHENSDPRGSAFAGAQACVTCHKRIVDNYQHNNHYKTSGKVNHDSLSNWIRDKPTSVYFGDSSFVQVKNENNSFIQSHVVNGQVVQSASFALAIGSAEKAQSYGYWKNQQLFQLPLTYFASLHSWTNSPGFPTAQPYFNRVILARCFECHASYVEKKDVQTGGLQIREQLIPSSFVYGIDCERCHGPAAGHVEFHETNPTVKEGQQIVSIKALSRQRQLDLCASCHSGNDLDVQRTLFAFQPGDTLANFYFPHFGAGGKDPDVHGKQMQLLQASQCFQQSDMTCGSCHNSHEPGKLQLEVYSAKCMNCHKQGSHVLQMKAGNKNCINCHMPIQESTKLNFNNGTGTKRIPYYLRTHRIAVYDESRNNDVNNPSENDK